MEPLINTIILKKISELKKYQESCRILKLCLCIDMSAPNPRTMYRTNEHGLARENRSVKREQVTLN